MKTKAFLIGILGLLLAFSMAGCEQAAGGGGGDNGGANNGGNNNNNDDDKKEDTPPAPTTGTLVIKNTAGDYYIVRVEVRESGEPDTVAIYRDAAVGKDGTVQFTLPPGAYDITLKDDSGGYFGTDTYYKFAVTVRLGQITNLTYNGVGFVD